MNEFSMIFMITTAGMVFVFLVVKTICKTVYETIRGKRDAGWDQNGNVATPPMFERMLDKSMAARDEKHHALEERVRVLEQIVTDGHSKKRTLAEEIDSLRDKS